MNLANLAVCSCSDVAGLPIDRPIVDVFGSDTLNGNLLHWRLKGGVWTHELVANPFAPRKLQGPVAAATLTAGRLDVFGVADDGELMHAFRVTLAGSPPQPWQVESLGKQQTNKSLVALWWSVNGAPRLDVFGVSADYKTLVQAYQVPGGAWQAFDLPYTGFGSGIGYLDDRLAAMSSGDGRLGIYAPSQGVGLQCVYWEGEWDAGDIAAGAGYVPGSQVVACSRGPGLADLFGWDSNAQFLHVYYDGANWLSRVLVLPLSAVDWSLAGGCARGSEFVDLFFIDGDSNIGHVTVANPGGAPTITFESLSTRASTRVVVPGNAFVTAKGPGDPKVAIDDGNMEAGKISNWTDPATFISSWFHVDVPTVVSVGLLARVTDAEAPCTLLLNLESEPQHQVTIANESLTEYPAIVSAAVSPGYVRVIMSGASRVGATFADVSQLLVTADVGVRVTCVDFATVLPRTWNNPDPNQPDTFFYRYGRRGPSAHLLFAAIPGEETEFFHAEIMVPADHDAPNTYYTAAEFAHGYLGIQRLPPGNRFQAERIVLFSIWDNDSSKPKVPAQVIALGPGVKVGTFDNEGSGGQTYLPFDWKPGQTQRFVVRARPDGADTLFTAWFRNGSAWQPIATIRYPNEATYLRDLGHFVENFSPDDGWINRLAYYGNQYAYTHSGHWHAMPTATLSGDFFALQRQRLDITGGVGTVDPTRFMLSIGGFIPPGTALGTSLTHPLGNFRVGIGTLPEPTLPPAQSS